MTLLPVLPWWILLPVIAVALLFMVWRIVLERLRPGGRAWVRRSVLVLLVAAAALRPGVPGGSVQAATADLNVFFVVDTTSSMVAEDYGNAAPRLAGVRQDIMAIAEELPGARFSVITFDTEARVRMPLTADTSALETITAILEPQVTVYAKGSSITAAREVLAERLSAARDSHPGRPRLVFYLGDGEQTSATEPAPLTLDDGLVAGGAVLGYGTSSGGRMKENTGMESDAGSPYIQDFTGGAVRDALSVIDEDRLRGGCGSAGRALRAPVGRGRGLSHAAGGAARGLGTKSGGQHFDRPDRGVLAPCRRGLCTRTAGDERDHPAAA